MFSLYFITDRSGKDDKAFVVSGSNDTDADCTDCAIALLTTPGFKGNEHPRECLNFWYNFKVCNFHWMRGYSFFSGVNFPHLDV